MVHLLSVVCRVPAPALLAPLRELDLRGETGAEAAERAEERVDLEQRVLAQLGRVDRELEVDRVRAVGDLEHEPRSAVAAAPAGRVLDEDADEGVAVEAGAVQARVLVDACPVRTRRDRVGTRRVLQQVGQGVPPFDRVGKAAEVVVYGPDYCSTAELPEQRSAPGGIRTRDLSMRNR
jgi:hypothetical protein